MQLLVWSKVTAVWIFEVIYQAITTITVASILMPLPTICGGISFLVVCSNWWSPTVLQSSSNLCQNSSTWRACTVAAEAMCWWWWCLCRSKISSRTARAFSRSRSRSYSVMRTFDEKRGVWRMRKQEDVIARYQWILYLRLLAVIAHFLLLKKQLVSARA